MNDDQLTPVKSPAPPASGFRSWFRPPFKNQGGLSSLQFIPLYVAGGIILFLVLWTITSFLLPPGLPKLWGELFAEIVFAVSAIAPALLISAIEDRPFALYGLPPRHVFGKLFWTGVLWG